MTQNEPADDVVEAILAEARRYVAREMCDFLGLMAEAGCDYEMHFEDGGEPEGSARDDARQSIRSLAALAIAQAAMLEYPDTKAQLSALSRPTEHVGEQADRDVVEAAEIGESDGYEKAIQEIDIATGGDGEFKGSTFPGETVDVPVMKQRIIDRFAALQSTRPARDDTFIDRLPTSVDPDLEGPPEPARESGQAGECAPAERSVDASDATATPATPARDGAVGEKYASAEAQQARADRNEEWAIREAIRDLTKQGDTE